MKNITTVGIKISKQDLRKHRATQLRVLFISVAVSLFIAWISNNSESVFGYQMYNLLEEKYRLLLVFIFIAAAFFLLSFGYFIIKNTKDIESKSNGWTFILMGFLPLFITFPHIFQGIAKMFKTKTLSILVFLIAWVLISILIPTIYLNKDKK